VSAGHRNGAALVWLFPAAWRRRYGAELAELIVEASGGGRVPWRIKLDVARAGAGERLLAAGLSRQAPPGERARGGALLVLWAFALLAIAGALVRKTSEHWQAAVGGAHALASAAFAALVAAGGVAALLVLAGAATALPALRAFLRTGGWPAIRARVLAALALTLVALAAGVAIVAWAGGLDAAQRNGADAGYAAAVVAWALLLCACLLAWTGAAAATARRLELAPATLALQARMALAATAAIVVAPLATGVWWVAVAHAAPGFLAAPAALIVAAALLLGAGALALTGARHASAALPRLRRAE